jgi:hypothetical protein
MPIVSAFGRLRQEDSEFEASQSYIARRCLKIKPKQENKKGLVM